MAGGEGRLRGWESLPEAKAVEMREGIVRRTLVYSDKMPLCHWVIKKGIRFGEHSHPYEQAGFVLRGKLRIVIGKEERDLTAGSAYLVPAGMRHDAVALEDVEVPDVFHP